MGQEGVETTIEILISGVLGKLGFGTLFYRMG